MKNVKRTLVMLALCVGFTMSASHEDEKIIGEKNLTIVEQNNTVSVSILNDALISYTLIVTNSYGEIIYKEVLGATMVIGKQFDFQAARKDRYNFTFVTNKGEKDTYKVVLGN